MRNEDNSSFSIVVVLPVDIAGGIYIEQRFPNLSKHHNDKWRSPIPEFLILPVQGEARELAHLTSSHVSLRGGLVVRIQLSHKFTCDADAPSRGAQFENNRYREN